jgi:hypothetical protein
MQAVMHCRCILQLVLEVLQAAHLHQRQLQQQLA